MYNVNQYNIILELMELRNKFDNDKSKIELLKQSRKFKPF